MPNNNPSSLGAFELNLRFPGQYFDKETNNHYNYYRDYSPEIGRYIESDPIGLRGGLNTYAYVGGKPLSWSDPSGLTAYQCRKPLDSLGGTGTRTGPDFSANPFYHQYSCVIDPDGQVTCGGQDRTGDAWSSPGKPSKDSYDPERCMRSQDNKCFDDCLIKEWQKPRPRFGIPFGMDCQDYDDDVNSRCRKECGLK